eukprot:scaffold7779_cov135-Isochrysis_galbana.AAC.1
MRTERPSVISAATRRHSAGPSSSAGHVDAASSAATGNDAGTSHTNSRWLSVPRTRSASRERASALPCTLPGRCSTVKSYA